MSSRIYASQRFRCPYSTCQAQAGGPDSRRVVRKGKYFRADDSRWISRFLCLGCRRSFSASRFTPGFGQKKRKINLSVYKLLNSLVSQRRISQLLHITRKTVVRKLEFLAQQVDPKHEQWLESLGEHRITEFQFDEMESFERSKCLPLSVVFAVEPGSRKILGFNVCSMPAKGPLAQISRAKYGPRADDRSQSADTLFSKLTTVIDPHAQITSDQNPHYPAWVARHFPHAKHIAVKGRRGYGGGQGELKKIGFDPLFALNHTAAMIRANVNRMIRKTWCTTKRMDRLVAHLKIYMDYHNSVLTQNPWPTPNEGA